MALATTPTTTVKNHFMRKLDARNTMLMSLLMGALVICAATAAHAQTAAPPAESRNSPPSQMSPGLTPRATDGIPQNKLTSKDVDAAFDRADANKDGMLDRKEAENMPSVAQRFDQIDSNRDGFISRDEFNKLAGS